MKKHFCCLLAIWMVLAGLCGCGAGEPVVGEGVASEMKTENRTSENQASEWEASDERLLEHAPESCEKIYVGKRSGRHSMPQEEINALLVEKARQGKCVVRLKGGDPFVFGRGGEEMQALWEAGIEVQEIPGITSAIAVPAAAGIPVTHRGVSRSFHVITGHTAENGKNLHSELEAVAKSEGTCVFLMGFSHLKEITEELVSHGKSPDTPAAVVHGEFDGTVQTVRGTLTDIAVKAEQSDIRMPAVIVVGGTAGMQL